MDVCCEMVRVCTFFGMSEEGNSGQWEDNPSESTVLKDSSAPI